jgi:ribosomal protein L11 methyltransferase
MFSVEIECDPEGRDLLIAELWEQGSAGIVELDERRIRAFFEDDRLRAIYPNGAWRQEEDRDWVRAAREKLPPMLVGSSFFLAPEWCADPTPHGRLRISVNPGMAFGTGAHETTQLVLEALEDHLRPGAVVLDVGTGSGILARAAELLGAGRVYACDTDPVAVDIAGRAFVGSADAVRSGVADLVVANINPEAIIGLSEELMRVLRPGGTALLSGFERNEVDEVKAAYRSMLEVRTKGNWALIAASRQPA